MGRGRQKGGGRGGGEMKVESYYERAAGHHSSHQYVGVLLVRVLLSVCVCVRFSVD